MDCDNTCDDSIVLFTEAALPLNNLCFTVLHLLLKADLISYQVLFILQEGEWVGCCKSMSGAASQHLQMCGWASKALLGCSHSTAWGSISGPLLLTPARESSSSVGLKGKFYPQGTLLIASVKAYGLRNWGSWVKESPFLPGEESKQ